MRNITYIAVLLFCFSQLAVSQQDEIDIDAIELSDSTVFNTSIKKVTPKLKFNTEVGMSYMFASNGMHGSALSLRPQATYPLGNKFGVSAGILAEYGNYYIPFYNSESGEGKMLPMTRMFIYASGHYSMNEKLTVSGSVYQQVLDVPNKNASPFPSSYKVRGVSAGFDYKLTPNITIGAQIRVESPNSHMNSGFYPGGGYYPFGM